MFTLGAPFLAGKKELGEKAEAVQTTVASDPSRISLCIGILTTRAP
jgi:hypothetical protein